MDLVEGADLEEGELVVRCDGGPATHLLSELDALQPACAVTIHKSHGSEYPAVVIPTTRSSRARQKGVKAPDAF